MLHLWLALAGRRLLERGWAALRATRCRELSASYWEEVARRMTEMVIARQTTIEGLRREARQRQQTYFAYDMWADDGLGPALLGDAV